MTKFFLILVLISLVSSQLNMACTENKPEREAVRDPNASPPRISGGIWLDAGYSVAVDTVEIVGLESDGAGLILRFSALAYHDGMFYVVGRAGSEIKVFDKTGSFNRIIDISDYDGVRSRAFYSIGISQDGYIFVLDVNKSEIIELTINGEIIRYYRPESGEPLGHLRPGGIQPVGKKNTRFVLLAPINEQYPMNDYLKRTKLLVRFNQAGEPEGRIINYSDIYHELNLLSFQSTAYTVYNEKIYFMESASHRVRVFSLSGSLEHEFGHIGRHQRVVDQSEPQTANMNLIKKYILQFSVFDAIKVLPAVDNYHDSVLIVTYSTPIQSEDNVFNNRVRSDHYMMIYTPDGQLLANDVSLPGRLLDIDSDGNLYCLLEYNPVRFVIGKMRISLLGNGG